MAGARLRYQGRFDAATLADQDYLRQRGQQLGPDHPWTFDAAVAVATDLALSGKYDAAAREARRLYDDVRAFYADSGHPRVLFCQNLLARFLRAAGRHDQAWGIEQDVRRGYGYCVDTGLLDRAHPWLLAHQVDYAATGRHATPGASDLERLAADAQDTRRASWRGLGADHPQTLAATVTLATIGRRIPGRLPEVIRLAADAERRYHATLPEHPYAYVSTAFLGSLLGQEGMTEEGAEKLNAAIAGLSQSVGPDHPYTRAAVATLAYPADGSGRPGPGDDAADPRAEVLDFTPIPL
jgi:hypothetical protein